MNPVGVALVGCGNIAGPYAEDLKKYAELNLIGVADVDAARAQSFAQQHSIEFFPTVEALLADARVQIIVNLTSFASHKDISERALNAGKHVYSEKPLANTPADAQFLVNLAQEKGLRLACSPFTLIGEAQQTAWKWIREGKLGQVRVVYAEVNWGRIESWHPAPIPFYEIGALYDVGVYPLTILTAIFGPVQRVTSFGQVLLPDRQTKDGQPYHVTTPDFAVTMLETESGTLLRLTTDFYVSNETSRQTGIEFHGDAGSLYLESWFMPNSEVQFAPFGAKLESISHVREGASGYVPWGIGVQELALAAAANRPHRFSGEHAAHLVEVLAAATESMRTRQTVTVTSRFSTPPPAAWAE
jgi:predicted dehydrogenase